MGTKWISPPEPRIIRVSKDDGTEEITETFRALRLLRDAYPGYESDGAIIDELGRGTTLQTMFAYYKADPKWAAAYMAGVQS